MELVVVHTAGPYSDALESRRAEFCGHGFRRCQGQIGPVVNRSQPGPNRTCRCLPAVVGREPGEIRLEHRHRRDAGRSCSNAHLMAEHDGSGQMYEVRGEGRDRVSNPPHRGHAQAETGVPGDGQPPDARHRSHVSGSEIHQVVSGAGSQDADGVISFDQVPRYAHDGVGHAVDRRDEALG